VDKNQGRLAAAAGERMRLLRPAVNHYDQVEYFVQLAYVLISINHTCSLLVFIRMQNLGDRRGCERRVPMSKASERTEAAASSLARKVAVQVIKECDRAVRDSGDTPEIAMHALLYATAAMGCASGLGDDCLMAAFQAHLRNARGTTSH
jgi:hypothetical protein